MLFFLSFLFVWFLLFFPTSWNILAHSVISLSLNQLPLCCSTFNFELVLLHVNCKGNKYISHAHAEKGQCKESLDQFAKDRNQGINQSQQNKNTNQEY